MSHTGVQLLTISELIAEEESRKPIITFNQPLDEILGGGIPSHRITEIFGDKGVGKTNLCCQLAINVQIPQGLGGLESECLYIDTENTLVLKRIEAMAEKCAVHCRSLEPSLAISTSSLLNGINFIQCGTVQELRSIIQDLDAFLSLNPKVKLIVIDSLAFLFYGGTEQFSERGKVLYEFSQMLFQVAKDYKVAIVVTNNMTTRFSMSGLDYRIPFLGETWTHIPNIRLELFSSDGGKSARVVKGKVMEHDGHVASFRITSAGFRE